MTTRKTLLVAAAAAVVFAGATTPLTAQVQARVFPGQWADYGTNSLGGRVAVNGSVRTIRSRGLDSANIRLDLSAHGYLLNRSFQIARVLVNVYERQGPALANNGTLDVYVGFHKRFGVNVRRIGQYGMVTRPHMQTVRFNKYVYVDGFIPTLVTGEALMGCELDVFFARFPNTGGVGLRGSTSVEAWTRISASPARWWVRNAGVVGSLNQLTDQTVNLDVWASVTNGIRGNASYILGRLDLLLQVWASYHFGNGVDTLSRLRMGRRHVRLL
jgi:hypothetical protein